MNFIVNSNNNKKMNYARGGKRIYFIIAFIWFFITSSYMVEMEKSLFEKFFLITLVSAGFSICNIFNSRVDFKRF